VAAKRDAVTTATAMLALAPGFVLPFVLTQRLGPGRSDLILLAASVGMTLMAILGNSIEMSTVAQVGRQAGLGRRFSRSSLRRYARRLLLIVLPAVAVVGTALILLYGWHAENRSAFLPLAAMLCVLPVLGTFSSIRSGQLIALGRSATAISVQALRTAVPLVLVLCWSRAPLWVLALGYVAGEVLRLSILVLAARHLGHDLVVTDDAVDHRGLLWQSASLATAQSGPATDRAFLNVGPVGSIASYEIADKIFYAGLQVVNSGFLLRRLGQWSQLVTRDPKAVRAMLRRELFVFGAIATVCSLLGIAACWLALTFAPVPDAWRTGIVWASIILLSMPMSAIGTACARLFVIGGRASLLVRFSVGFTIANAGLDALGFVLLGVIGIPIATVVARLGAMVCYLLVLWKSVVPRLETPPVASPETADDVPAASAVR
jgi:Na+-driven multidrug efflux pump